MRRYLLFLYDPYYPNGGWDDLIGDYDTKEEVTKVIKTLDREYSPIVQIVDTENPTEVMDEDRNKRKESDRYMWNGPPKFLLE